MMMPSKIVAIVRAKRAVNGSTKRRTRLRVEARDTRARDLAKMKMKSS
jgi:hypothetical protein